MEVRVEKIRVHDVHQATEKLQELYDAEWRMLGGPIIKDNNVIVFLERESGGRPIRDALKKDRKVEIQPPEEE